MGRLDTATCTVKLLTLEATFLVTHSSKRSYKISHPPQLLTSSDALHSFAVSSKIGLNFSNKGVLKLKLQENSFNKTFATKPLSSLKQKIRKIRMLFDIENSL